MSQIDKESLSALLDNEADDLELRRVLKACEQDSELSQTWERYSLVQSVLHESAVPVSPSLSQRIAAQIETEAAPEHKTRAAAGSYWQQSAAKLAIAASVAVVFMFAVQSNLNPEPDSVSAPAIAQGTETEVQEATALPAAGQSAPLIASEAVDPVALEIARQRLRDYIESMSLSSDEEEPIHMEHIQDSPLFRLVNELQKKP